MKLNLPNAITSRVGRQTLMLQKHSPRLLFVSGMVLMGATVVSASRATLHLEEVLDEVRTNRETLEHNMSDKRYTPAEYTKINNAITFHGYVKVAKLYLPSVALGVAAVGCLTTSHTQLTRRNAGLSAALAATERALDRYRQRVRDDLGEEKEEHLWRGIHTDETTVLDDQGNPTKSKVKKQVGGGTSPYARVWGRDTSSEWDPRPQLNLAKLRSVQEWGTIRLNAKGHLFLNEIFDELGLSRTPGGAVTGWKSVKYGGRDGYVDLGVLSQGDDVEFLDFVQGREDSIMLDFNVDGEIWRTLDDE